MTSDKRAAAGKAAAPAKRIAPAKSIDVSMLDAAQLNNLIDNARRLGRTTEPIYTEALEARQRLQGKGLEFEKSMRIIRAAARERRFLSYKDLADASGVAWSRAHYAMNGHLWDLVEFGTLRGWPMLSAIVVNKSNVDTGAMEPETLRGFITAARALGLIVDDDEAFLKEQQAAVFAWAAGAGA